MIDFIIGLLPINIRTGEVTNTILVIINRYIKISGYSGGVGRFIIHFS